MHALLGGGARDIRDEASAAKDRAHESVVEFSPVVVNGTSRGGEKHTQAAWAEYRLNVSISVGCLLVPTEELCVGILACQKWHGEGFRRYGL